MRKAQERGSSPLGPQRTLTNQSAPKVPGTVLIDNLFGHVDYNPNRFQTILCKKILNGCGCSFFGDMPLDWSAIRSGDLTRCLIHKALGPAPPRLECTCCFVDELRIPGALRFEKSAAGNSIELNPIY